MKTRILSLNKNDVYVRVIDVGAGLCCVVVMPDNHYMIYDAGYGKCHR